jgi:alkanesulfonate monooxygenase SsuD/methylene tetrahydromethanopterin reductase-like flavin-dependent oxidoreductase (luciferase family)
LKFGLDLPNMGVVGSPQVLAKLAQEAETVGWDGVFVWDSLYVELDDPRLQATYDPWIGLTAMAASTERIRLGMMITPLARRRPWKLARETVTLDHFSKGRIVLPVGLGAVDDSGFSKVGEETDRKIRAQQLDEALEILNGLWSGRPFRYDGRHYRVQEMAFYPPPFQSPRIPIWVVGAWPKQKSMLRALRWDGILPIKMTADGQNLAEEGYALAGGMTPNDVREMKAFVDERRSQNAPFDIVLEGKTPGEDREKAKAIVSPYAEAGATWWVEAIWEFFYASPGDLEVIRNRIRQGPPI